MVNRADRVQSTRPWLGSEPMNDDKRERTGVPATQQIAGIPGVGSTTMIDLVGRVAMPHDKPTTVATFDCNHDGR
jgi:hypothetical protein